MIGASDKWRQAHTGTIVPESFIEITYKVTDPGAQESATLSHNGAAYYSKPEKVLENQATSTFKQLLGANKAPKSNMIRAGGKSLLYLCSMIEQLPPIRFLLLPPAKIIFVPNSDIIYLPKFTN